MQMLSYKSGTFCGYQLYSVAIGCPANFCKQRHAAFQVPEFAVIETFPGMARQRKMQLKVFFPEPKEMKSSSDRTVEDETI